MASPTMDVGKWAAVPARLQDHVGSEIRISAAELRHIPGLPRLLVLYWYPVPEGGSAPHAPRYRSAVTLDEALRLLPEIFRYAPDAAWYLSSPVLADVGKRHGGLSREEIDPIPNEPGAPPLAPGSLYMERRQYARSILRHLCRKGGGADPGSGSPIWRLPPGS